VKNARTVLLLWGNGAALFSSVLCAADVGTKLKALLP